MISRLLTTFAFSIVLSAHVFSQQWITYTSANTTGLNGNLVTSITSDDNGNMWFGTDQGAYRYAILNGLWTHYKNTDNTQVPVFVNRIVKDNLGRIWVATNSGLGLFNAQSGNFTNYNTSNGLPGNIVKDVTSSGTSNSSYWIGTYGHGVCYLSGSNFIVLNTSSGLAGNFVYRICKGNGTDVWIGTSSGLTLYNNGVFTNFHTADGLPSNSVLSMARASNGTMWFGTPNGSASYNGTQWQIWNTSHGLAGNMVYDIYSDAAGTLWFATDMGISRYNGNTWVTYNQNNGPTNNTVMAIHEYTPGEYWFGLGDGAVSILDQTNWRQLSKRMGIVSNIISIAQDTSKALWFGSNYYGLCRYKNNVWDKFNVSNSALLSNTVRAVCGDATGNMWVGTYEGLSKFNGTMFTNYTVSHGLISNQVNCLLRDNQNRMWVGTSNGLSMIKNNFQFDNYNDITGLVQNKIIKMACDAQNKLWLYHADNANFSVFNGTQFVPFQRPLLNGSAVLVKEIFADRNGTIWALSNTDAFYLNLAQQWVRVYEVNGNQLRLIQHTTDNSYWFAYYSSIRRLNGSIINTYNSLSGFYPYNIASMFTDADGWLWVAHSGAISKNHPDLLPMSVQNTIQNHDIKIFPNPFIDQFIISKNNTNISKVDVLDLSGKNIYSENTTSNPSGNAEISVKLPRIPAGIYLVKIYTSQFDALTFKVVKIIKHYCYEKAHCYPHTSDSNIQFACPNRRVFARR
jgi:ligand-binding sensor domain-containing protein